MATLRGLHKAGFTYREIGRMLGVSDSTVREAFGGNRRTGMSDERRERTFYRLDQLARAKTGEKPPSRVQHAPPPPRVKEDAPAGQAPGLMVGKKDKEDKNGRVTKWVVSKGQRGEYEQAGLPHVTGGVSHTDIEQLVSAAQAKYGNQRAWIVAVYGEFFPTNGYSANDSATGMHRGWTSRKVIGDPSGIEHPVAQWTREHSETLQARLQARPTGITREVDKQERQSLRDGYAADWASDVIGFNYTAVYAVKIIPAKQYGV